ncbi:hypothetical protein BC936DRAFT_140081 [Jimgerdemannia flammicorona]|uniref:Copper type II ascorbate-dependent monooxygenase C-terminal domain-containing protein n=1 Tax=Jimgerdemannia flammicorona TaxID=994334 RepID=A0A433DHB2_9FUNG|nr:hypothetical protein BC936DRAFT_140081 [Jimgerdemannia flammicorona]
MVVGDPNVLGGFMPFGSSRIEKQFICPEECTSKWPWDINVFGSALHMHAYGKQIWTGVTTPSPSGGNLVITSDLDRDNFYEFTFQHISMVNRTIKRGDRINVHCVYDLTTNLFPKQRPNDTGVTFSLGSEDEMCMEFIYYYPRFPTSPQFDTCGLYENETTTCGEFDKNGTISLKIQNPVSPGSATADPVINGDIAFGTDFSNGTCVFDAAHLALVPNGTVVYQKPIATNATNTTNITNTTNTTAGTPTPSGAGNTAITSWIVAIVAAVVVAMYIQSGVFVVETCPNHNGAKTKTCLLIMQTKN